MAKKPTVRRGTSMKNIKPPTEIKEGAIAKASQKAGHIAYEMVGMIRDSMAEGGGKKRPSDPPNPPHAQTGWLKARVRAAEDSAKKSVWVVGVTKQAFYGKIHEGDGEPGHFTYVNIPAHTRTSSKGKSYKVAAYQAKYPTRPFMRPAFKAIVEKYKK